MKLFTYEESYTDNTKPVKTRAGVLNLCQEKDLPSDAVVIGATTLGFAKDRISKVLPRFVVNGVQYTTVAETVSRILGYAYVGENEFIEVRKDLSTVSFVAMGIVAVLIGTLFASCGLFF